MMMMTMMMMMIPLCMVDETRTAGLHSLESKVTVKLAQLAVEAIMLALLGLLDPSGGTS